MCCVCLSTIGVDDTHHRLNWVQDFTQTRVVEYTLGWLGRYRRLSKDYKLSRLV